MGQRVREVPHLPIDPNLLGGKDLELFSGNSYTAYLLLEIWFFKVCIPFTFHFFLGVGNLALKKFSTLLWPCIKRRETVVSPLVARGPVFAKSSI